MPAPAVAVAVPLPNRMATAVVAIVRVAQAPTTAGVPLLLATLTLLAVLGPAPVAAATESFGVAGCSGGGDAGRVGHMNIGGVHGVSATCGAGPSAGSIGGVATTGSGGAACARGDTTARLDVLDVDRDTPVKVICQDSNPVPSASPLKCSHMMYSNCAVTLLRHATSDNWCLHGPAMPASPYAARSACRVTVLSIDDLRGLRIGENCAEVYAALEEIARVRATPPRVPGCPAPSARAAYAWYAATIDVADDSSTLSCLAWVGYVEDSAGDLEEVLRCPCGGHGRLRFIVLANQSPAAAGPMSDSLRVRPRVSAVLEHRRRASKWQGDLAVALTLRVHPVLLIRE